jgi:hypothetical protein
MKLGVCNLKATAGDVTWTKDGFRNINKFFLTLY